MSFPSPCLRAFVVKFRFFFHVISVKSVNSVNASPAPCSYANTPFAPTPPASKLPGAPHHALAAPSRRAVVQRRRKRSEGGSRFTIQRFISSTSQYFKIHTQTLITELKPGFILGIKIVFLSNCPFVVSAGLFAVHQRRHKRKNSLHSFDESPIHAIISRVLERSIFEPASS